MHKSKAVLFQNTQAVALPQLGWSVVLWKISTIVVLASDWLVSDGTQISAVTVAHSADVLLHLCGLWSAQLTQQLDSGLVRDLCRKILSAVKKLAHNLVLFLQVSASGSLTCAEIGQFQLRATWIEKCVSFRRNQYNQIITTSSSSSF